jgi:hypothetical protein
MRPGADLLFDQEEVGLYFGIDKYIRGPIILGEFLLTPIKLYTSCSGEQSWNSYDAQ